MCPFHVWVLMFEFALVTLRSGIRGRSFQVVFVLGLALIALAFLSGNFSPRQPRTVALDVGLSGLRIALVLLNLFWVQELVAREVDRKTVIFSLAYPVSRAVFLLGRFLGVQILSVVACVILGLLLLVAVLLAGGGYEQEHMVSLGWPYVICLLGVMIDAAVVAAFALLISSLSTVSVLPLMLGLAFAIGGKALGATLLYIADGADGDTDMVKQYGAGLRFAQWLIPDLSRLDWRDWPMYGLVPEMSYISFSLLMALSYIVLLLGLAIWYFSRREFS